MIKHSSENYQQRLAAAGKRGQARGPDHTQKSIYVWNICNGSKYDVKKCVKKCACLI